MPPNNTADDNSAVRVLLTKCFGPGGVTTWTRDSVANLGLPLPAQRALVDAGVPMHVASLFEAAQRPTAAGFGSESVTHDIRIGTDFGTDIVIDVASGAVWSKDLSGRHMTRYVNADACLFAQFLCRTQALREALTQVGDEEADDKIAKVIQELTMLDPSAFRDPETWWSVVFEQMVAGLM